MLGFFRRFPADWEKAVGIVASVFSFSASEILDMSAHDLKFWTERAEEVIRYGR